MRLENELYHYGVVGMKWGVRRSSTSGKTTGKKYGKTIKTAANTVGKAVAKEHQIIARYNRYKQKSIEKDRNSIQSNKQKMLSYKSKSGKILFTEKDIDSMVKALDKQIDELDAKARKHEYFANQLISEIKNTKVKDLY